MQNSEIQSEDKILKKLAACYVSVDTWKMTFLRIRMILPWELKIAPEAFHLL